MKHTHRMNVKCGIKGVLLATAVALVLLSPIALLLAGVLEKNAWSLTIGVLSTFTALFPVSLAAAAFIDLVRLILWGIFCLPSEMESEDNAGIYRPPALFM